MIALPKSLMLQSLVSLLKTEEDPVKYFILAGPSILSIVSEPTATGEPKFDAQVAGRHLEHGGRAAGVGG